MNPKTRPASRRPRLYPLTGFQGKTLWDWLELLIIPIVLAIGGFTLDQLQSDREAARAAVQRELEQTRADQRTESERAIATDNQREEALQTYLDDMSELLLVGGLRTSSPEAEIRSVARTRTLSTLRRLDRERKGFLLQFLYESQVIGGPDPLVQLHKADLSGAILSGAILSGAILVEASLSGANLANATLSGAILMDANLDGADLTNANLQQATLNLDTLKGASLTQEQREQVVIGQEAGP